MGVTGAMAAMRVMGEGECKSVLLSKGFKRGWGVAAGGSQFLSTLRPNSMEPRNLLCFRGTLCARAFYEGTFSTFVTKASFS